MLHVNWLSRRHKFSLIPASAEVSRMVLPTCIILALSFFIFFYRLYLWGLFCLGLSEHEYRIWVFTPFHGGGSYHNTAWGVFEVFQHILVSSTRGVVDIFLLFHIPECFRILFKLGLSVALTVPSIVTFLSTVVAYNIIQVSPRSLLLLFSVALVIPIFPVLRKHELVSDLVALMISIRVISRLIF